MKWLDESMQDPAILDQKSLKLFESIDILADNLPTTYQSDYAQLLSNINTNQSKQVDELFFFTLCEHENEEGYGVKLYLGVREFSSLSVSIEHKSKQAECKYNIEECKMKYLLKNGPKEKYELKTDIVTLTNFLIKNKIYDKVIAEIEGKSFQLV